MFCLVFQVAVLAVFAESNSQCDTMGMLQNSRKVAARSARLHGAQEPLSAVEQQHEGASANVTTPEKYDPCPYDSMTMWGRDITRKLWQGALIKAFHRLTRQISAAIKSNNVPCHHVTIAASLVSNVSVQGGKHADDENDVSKIPLYTGPAGCGIYIVSDWQTAMFTNAVSTEVNDYESTNGWHLVPFSSGELLQNTPLDFQATELQRLYNLVKVRAHAFLPEDVQQFTFGLGNVNCDFPAFSEKVADAWDPTVNIYTLQHPLQFGVSLATEFQESIRASDGKEADLATGDILRLRAHLGNQFLTQHTDIADVTCVSWVRSDALDTFAARWFWYTSSFTVHMQLSWTGALNDCGEGLKIKFLPPMPTRS